jgi:hypothetical protein
VSASVSPFAIDEMPASANPMQVPPRRPIALSNERRVRVEG